MDSVLELEQVSVSFGSSRILENVSLSVPMSVVIGLVGPNGAGKSTLLNVAVGLLHPDRGRVKIRGKDLHQERTEALSQVGYVSDVPLLYGHLTAREFLLLMGRIKAVPDVGQRVADLMEEFRLPADSRLLDEYSLGMKRKAAVCSALISRPPLLIMDEPFNAVDYAGTVTLQHLIGNLHRQGTTVLLSTHLMDFVAQCCTHVVFMNGGKLTTPLAVANLLSAHGRIEAAFLAYCEEG